MEREIKKIIVHCTATKEGQPVTVADINRWHKERGFANIGYHYVIYIDGSLHLGRKVSIAGAHTSGHNANSIGVCYVGGLDANGKAKDTRTQEQKRALEDLLRELREQYPNAHIYGHRDFAAKDCPCFDAKEEYREL